MSNIKIMQTLRNVVPEINLIFINFVANSITLWQLCEQVAKATPVGKRRKKLIIVSRFWKD